MHNIGIDCRLAGQKHAGIGRYIQELVQRVVQEESIHWTLFFAERNQLDLTPRTNLSIVYAPVRHYSVAEQTKMPSIFAREHVDLLHVPHLNVPLFYTGKFVVTIHDLLWHAQSNANATTLSPLVHAIKYQAYKAVTHHAITASEGILVPAQTVKENILSLFPGIQEDKVIVTYEGVEKKFTEHRVQGTVKKNILFYTGSLYPHKNVMLVVKALKQLSEFELCISSSRSVFVDTFLAEVTAMGLGDRVRHLGRLSDEELLAWYEKSFALVQPSLSEGFGLTGVEAMAASLPVIASDIPVFSEIYGDGYISFDPHSVDSFVAAVKRLESEDYEEWRAKGRSVASRYSWDKMATETLEFYKATLAQ